MPRGVGLTRDKVIDTAAQIANEGGLAALDLTELAKRCGVRKPSLYKHIHGVDDLHSALAKRAYCELHHALNDAEDTVDLAMKWRAWALANRGTYEAATPTHLGRADGGREAGERVLAALLRHLEAQGLCGSGGVCAARAVRSLVHGFVVLEFEGGFGLDESVDESFRAAVQALVAGLRA